MIDGLNELKSLVIGMNSFTTKKYCLGHDSSRSFSISNCAKLESIEIGPFSFSDYGGGFELKNLPKLYSIRMSSYNFYYCSLEIKGIMEIVIANE